MQWTQFNVHLLHGLFTCLFLFQRQQWKYTLNLRSLYKHWTYCFKWYVSETIKTYLVRVLCQKTVHLKKCATSFLLMKFHSIDLLFHKQGTGWSPRYGILTGMWLFKRFSSIVNGISGLLHVHSRSHFNLSRATVKSWIVTNVLFRAATSKPSFPSDFFCKN